jgi:hypothetical protein
VVDIIDSTVERIVKNGFDPIHSPMPHKVAVMLTTAQGLIDNGGFEYFFGVPFNIEPNMEDFIRAYQTVGAIKSASLFELALVRSQALQPEYEDLNKILWANSESNYKQLMVYIEENPNLFT